VTTSRQGRDCEWTSSQKIRGITDCGIVCFDLHWPVVCETILSVSTSKGRPMSLMGECRRWVFFSRETKKNDRESVN